ncbi:MAG: hypothetical protein WBB86_05605 [Candidatus Omnitrophota bacterium]
MNFFYLGIDHKRASLDKREEAYRQRGEINFFCRHSLADAAVLFTCNRVEIYGAADNKLSASREISLLRERFPGLFGAAYVKDNTIGTLRHALRLASGLQSQLVGESEILKQLSSWLIRELGSSHLGSFWGEVISAAEWIRARSGLDRDSSNIADIILDDLGAKKRIVVIGTGKIAALFAKSKIKGVEVIFVSRKKHKRARRLAKKTGGAAALMNDLQNVVLEADALISATSSPHYVIGRDQILEIMRKRQKDLHVFDLAVPRDIEPGARSVPGVVANDLDDLTANFDKQNIRLLPRIKKAELLIEWKIKMFQKELWKDAFKSWYKTQPAGIKAG